MSIAKFRKPSEKYYRCIHTLTRSHEKFSQFNFCATRLRKPRIVAYLRIVAVRETNLLTDNPTSFCEYRLSRIFA